MVKSHAEITLAEEINVTLRPAEGVNPCHCDQRGHQVVVTTADGAIRILVCLLDGHVGVIKPLEFLDHGVVRAGHILYKLKQVRPQQL